MRYSQIGFAITAGAVLAFAAGAGLLSGAQGAGSPQAVGTVDQRKVMDSYPKAQQASEEIQTAQTEIQKLVNEGSKEFEQAKGANKPPAELEGLQRRLRKKITSEYDALQVRAQELEKQILKEVDQAIQAEARASGCDVVLMKEAVLMGGTDLTDAVIKRLTPVANKGTPAPDSKSSAKAAN